MGDRGIGEKEASVRREWEWGGENWRDSERIKEEVSQTSVGWQGGWSETS